MGGGGRGDLGGHGRVRGGAGQGSGRRGGAGRGGGDAAPVEGCPLPTGRHLGASFPVVAGDT